MIINYFLRSLINATFGYRVSRVRRKCVRQYYTIKPAVNKADYDVTKCSNSVNEGSTSYEVRCLSKNGVIQSA